MFQSTMLTTRIRGRSKLEIPSIFLWPRSPNSIRCPLWWTLVFTLSIRESDDRHMLDVVALWNLSTNDNLWMIDMEDGMNLMERVNKVTFYIPLTFDRDLILDWERSGDGSLRESEVDSHRRRHCSVMEPKFGIIGWCGIPNKWCWSLIQWHIGGSTRLTLQGPS